MKKIRIKGLPKAASGGVHMGGLLNLPFAGSLSINPFGLINSDTSNLDRSINDSVKPVDKEIANIEAEKGEILLKFEEGGLFKIKGKKHSQGGTPLKADPMDFIFSDKKDLAISKEDGENFDLDMSKYKKENTPSKLLEREVDVKLYNKFLSILNNPNSDNYAKSTAKIMLKKYADKIGQIAFLQEASKNFPTGIPPVSQDTAPVMQDSLDSDIKSSKIFALGGPYEGEDDSEKCKCGKDEFGNCNPCSDSQISDLLKSARVGSQEDVKNGYVKLGRRGTQTLYHKGTDDGVLRSTVGPKMSDEEWKAYIKTDDWKRKRKALTKGTDDLVVVNEPDRGGKFSFKMTPGEVSEINPDLKPKNNIPNVPTIPFSGFNVGMNDLEKLSVAAPYLLQASLPTYYDMLIQKHSPNINLDRGNNRQEISDIQQSVSNATSESYSNLDPRIASFVAASAMANGNKSIQQSNSNLRSENRQVANAESQINYEQQQRDDLFNLNQIQQVYRNNILSDQRSNEMLANASAASLNNFNSIQGKLDSLNFALTRSVLPHLTNAYYDKQGNLLGQGDIDSAWSDKIAYIKQMSPLSLSKNRMPVTTGFGSMNSVSGSGNPSYTMFNDMIEQIYKTGSTEDKLKLLAVMNNTYKANEKGTSPNDEMLYRVLNPLAGLYSQSQ